MYYKILRFSGNVYATGINKEIHYTDKKISYTKIKLCKLFYFCV